MIHLEYFQAGRPLTEAESRLSDMAFQLHTGIVFSYGAVRISKGNFASKPPMTTHTVSYRLTVGSGIPEPE